MPPRERFGYAFDRLADVIDRFTEAVGLAVQAASGATEAELERVAATAMRAWPT